MNKPRPSAQPPFDAAWHGFAVLRVRPAAIAADHWSLSEMASGWQLELAGRVPEVWETFTRRLFVDQPVGDLQLHTDAESGEHSMSLFDGELLSAALIVKPRPLDVRRDWLARRLGTPLDPAERFRLYAGRPDGALAPRGSKVCFCCDVRHQEIVAAVRAGAASIDLVGIATRAGTNCGYCRPAIGRLVENELALR